MTARVKKRQWTMALEQTSADTNQDSLLSELARGAKETFKNAEQLFQEASLLRQHGSFARALFLHQISMEECAKVDILGGYATGLLMGYEVDFKRLAKALASHEAKNRTNAYMLEPNEEELAARKREDWKGANELFTKLQTGFHLKSNTTKNASLYVDFRAGKFVTPSDMITETMVSEIADMNEKYLGLRYPMLNMLLKWEKDTDNIRQILTSFGRRAEQLKSAGLHPEKMMEMLMQEMLEAVRAKRRGDVAKDAG